MDIKIKNKVLVKRLKQMMLDYDLKFYEELIEFLVKKSKL